MFEQVPDSWGLSCQCGHVFKETRTIAGKRFSGNVLSWSNSTITYLHPNGSAANLNQLLLLSIINPSHFSSLSNSQCRNALAELCVLVSY